MDSRAWIRCLALPACLLASACSRDAAATPPKPAAPAAKVELMVYAATSTRDALQALESVYETTRGVDLVFNFGSSGDLSRQIVAAAKADVFLSADFTEMNRVEDAKLVADGTRRDLLSNQLAVIEPTGAQSIFTLPFAPAQLADPRVQHLSLANVDTVPAGRYAKAWLEKAGAWSLVEARVLPAVDVRAALAAVEAGGAQAGIVYRTDVARSTKARTVFDVPLEEGPEITYPVAAIAGREQLAEARSYIEFLGSGSARATWETLGFIVLPQSDQR